MKPPVRGATPADYPAIRAIIADAFAKNNDMPDDEAGLWDHLAANDAALTPEMVRLALGPDGAPVACTVILPRRIMGPVGPVDGAIFTLVACRSDVQGQGYGGATVTDALRYAAERGFAMAILYGHPGYYPRHGFVPVLPAIRTILPAKAPESSSGEVMLRPAAETDLPALTGLFERHLGSDTCSVARTPDPWLWQVRPGRTARLLLLDEIAPAYALVSEHPKDEMLFVHEAATDDPAAARRLLTALQQEAARQGLKEVRLRMPAGNLVTRTATARDAEQRYIPARPGMVAVTNWEALLPAGFTAGAEGLSHEGRLILAAPEADLVRLAFGYRTARELLLAGTADLAGGDADLALLDRLFPSRSLCWSLAPYWQ